MGKFTSAGAPMNSKMPLILIVDDDWMNRDLLQAYLDGYQVEMASNGEMALQMAARNPPDLVLLDLRLPGMSGYEVCARLKADELTHNTPVLIISAMEGDEARQRALQAGADDFLLKPFDSILLLARIRNLLHLKSLHDEMERRERMLWGILNSHLNDQTARRIMDDWLNADVSPTNT